jgi:hypothetical protein
MPLLETFSGTLWIPSAIDRGSAIIATNRPDIKSFNKNFFLYSGKKLKNSGFIKIPTYHPFGLETIKQDFTPTIFKNKAKQYVFLGIFTFNVSPSKWLFFEVFDYIFLHQFIAICFIRIINLA